MNEDIQKSTENIPAVEKSLTITKLLTIILKSASIEIRVNFDFLYKDTIAAYNHILFTIILFISFPLWINDGEDIKKDSDPQVRQNTLSTLIVWYWYEYSLGLFVYCNVYNERTCW